MRVLQILSKIVLIFAIVGVAFTSIGATLVASDVLNMENQFLHFLSVTAEISKGQLVGTLTAAAVSLLFGGIITVFVYRYFTAELKEGTPFTNAGADRIKWLGIMQIVLSIISTQIVDVIYEKIGLAEWNRFDLVFKTAEGKTTLRCGTGAEEVITSKAEERNENEKKDKNYAYHNGCFTCCSNDSICRDMEYVW